MEMRPARVIRANTKRRLAVDTRAKKWVTTVCVRWKSASPKTDLKSVLDVDFIERDAPATKKCFPSLRRIATRSKGGSVPIVRATMYVVNIS
jgi:hypothetical protein